MKGMLMTHNQHRERNSRQLADQQRNPRHAPVDETIGQQKALQTQRRRKNPASSSSLAARMAPTRCRAKKCRQPVAQAASPSEARVPAGGQVFESGNEKEVVVQATFELAKLPLGRA